MRCAVLLVCVLAAGCGKAEGPNAKAGVPDDWTHKELVEHLNKKGLNVRLIPTDFGSFYGPSAFIVPQDSPYADEKKLADDWREKRAAATTAYCTLRKTPQDAKDDAGASGRKLAAGRFVFEADPAELARIKSALP